MVSSPLDCSTSRLLPSSTTNHVAGLGGEQCSDLIHILSPQQPLSVMDAFSMDPGTFLEPALSALISFLGSSSKPAAMAAATRAVARLDKSYPELRVSARACS